MAPLSPLVIIKSTSMRVPAPILDEKELTRLLKENPVLLTSAGHGLHDINIFRRRKRVSQGDGFLANVLAKVGPRIFPFLKRYILPAAKQMGSDVLSDMSSGRSTLRKSLKKRGLQSLGNVTRKVMTGEGARRRRRRGAGMMRGTTLSSSSTTTTTTSRRPRRTTRMTTRARRRRPPSSRRSSSRSVTLVKRKKAPPPRPTLRKRVLRRKTISWKKRGCSQKKKKQGSKKKNVRHGQKTFSHSESWSVKRGCSKKKKKN